MENFMDDLFGLYIQNSFGSISKRELDIYLFHAFRKMGKIQGDDAWKIAQSLRISKSKAQTLLYESTLRYGMDDVNSKIKAALNSLPRLIDGEVVWLMVGDKYVRETMRAYLMERNIVTDLSFASEIIKMPVEGYWELQEKYNKENLSKMKREEFIKKLKKMPKDMLSDFLSQTVGNAVSDGVKQLFEMIKNHK